MPDVSSHPFIVLNYSMDDDLFGGFSGERGPTAPVKSLQKRVLDTDGVVVVPESKRALTEAQQAAPVDVVVSSATPAVLHRAPA